MMQQQKLDGLIWWVKNSDDEYEEGRSWLSQYYQVEIVASETGTIVAASGRIPDIILSDVATIELKAFQLLHSLRTEIATQEVPIILLATADKEKSCLEAIEAGADDYLLEPFSAGELLTRVKVNLKMARGKKAEKILHEKEKFLDTLIGNLPGTACHSLDRQTSNSGLWSCEFVTNTVYWSPECYKLYGFGPDVLPSYNNWINAVHPNDRDRMALRMREIQEGSEEWNEEFRILHPECGERWLASTAIVIRDARGRALGFSGINIDISDRKRTQQRLAIQYAVTRVLAEATNLAEAIPSILRSLCESLEWQVGIIWGVDHQARVMRCINTWYASSIKIEDFEASSHRITFAPGEGLPGRVWASSQPVWIEEIVKDDNFKRANVAAREGLHSAIGFPICLGNETLGVIECFSDRIQKPDEDLLQMMTTIGSQIGQFIERKRTEEARRESEDKYRWIFQTAGVSIWEEDFTLVKALIDELKAQGITDLRQYFNERPDKLNDAIKLVKIREVNQQTLKMFGAQTKNELLSSLEQIFVPETSQVFLEEMIALASGRRYMESETIIKTLNGDRRYVLFTIAFPEQEVGYESVLVSVLDITARKKAEEALILSEERFRLVTNAVAGIVYDWDVETGEVYRSEGLYQLIGAHPQDVPPTREWWVERIHPNDLDRIQQMLVPILTDSSERYESEYRVRHEDGRWLHVWDRGYLLRDPNGRLKRVIGYTADITERQLAEQERSRLLAELEEKQRLLEAVLQQMPAGLVLAEAPGGRVLLMNNQVLEILRAQGLDRETIEEYTLPPLSLFYPDGRAYQPEDVPLARSLIAGEVVKEEVLVSFTDDGSIILQVDSAPIRNGAGDIVAAIVTFADITKRKQNEEALRQSEEFNRRVLDSTNDCIEVLDLEGHLLYMNVGGQRLLEIDDLTPYLNNNWLDFWQGADRHKALEALSVAKLGGVGKFQGYCPTINGTPKWWEVKITPLLDAAEHVLRLVSISRDVTKRKQAEEALRQKQEWLDLAQTAAKLGSFEWNIQTGVNTWSKELEAIYGLNPGEFGGSYEEWKKLVHPDDLAKAEADVLSSLTTGQFFTDFRAIWPDGSIHWLHARAKVFFDDRGKPLQMVGFNANITDRKQAEEALRESEARFRWIFESNVIAMAFWELDGNVTEANDAYLQLVGYTREEMQRGELPWSVLSSPDYWELDKQIVEELKQFGVSTPVKKHYAHKAGHRVPILIGCAFRQGSQHDGIAFVIDLTEREQVEIERERLLQRERTAREAAESANRIKDEFLAVLSHELRTPLNPILGWSQLLRNGKTDPAMFSKGLETIERNVKLQIQLIDDLLDVSRILRGKLHLNVAPVNLATTITAALETVSLAAKAKSIQIQSLIETEPIQVMGDESRLQQVVWNLLSNAIKFTPSGGRVQVCVRSVEGMAKITVSDTGAGISPDFLPYVFEQFRQADSSITRKFGGLGLGLAIVHHLVELHGGTVKAESSGLGQGATFTVKLPLACTNSQPPPDGAKIDDAPNLSGLRILVVDDDPSTREFLVFALEQLGAAVIGAKSALEGSIALDRLPFDILLSDIGMPEMDGYTFIRQVRSKSPENGGKIPAIALTAHATELDRQLALGAGFQSHVPKPVDFIKLVMLIVRLTGR